MEQVNSVVFLRLGEMALFESALHRFRHLLRLGFVRLAGGEHDDKKCEEKCNKVRIGNQPPLMAFWFWSLLASFHAAFSFSTAASGASFPFPGAWRE